MATDLRSTQFVGSETSRVEVSIYPIQAISEDGILQSVLKFTSVPAKEDTITTEHVTSVQTSKQLGSPSGKFTIEIKGDRDLRDAVHDGDWIDIVFTRHAARYHVLRGVILTISKTTTALSGATVATYTLVGADFGAIFEEQGMWFEMGVGPGIFPLIASRLWNTRDGFANARPDVTVAGILHGFLVPANNAAAGYRVLPDALPLPERVYSQVEKSRALKRNFVDSYVFVDGYSHVPKRTSAIIPTAFTATAGTIWALASEFADFMLCELFTDLVDVPETQSAKSPGSPEGSILVADAYLAGPSEPGETHMGVIYRDRPFPNSVRDGEDLLDAPYFRLPLTEVLPQEVSSSSLARQGMLRKNTFFFGPSALQESITNIFEFQRPIIDAESIEHHGMRRLDARSRYFTSLETVSEANLTTTGPLNPDEQNKLDEVYRGFSYDYRNIVRDLNCMNHLLDAGTIELNRGFPEIRIGTRFRILGASPQEDYTAYVESVAHSWNYQRGMRTSLMVTHGWNGTDEDYTTQLRDCIKRYTLFVPTPEVDPIKTTGDDGSSRITAYMESMQRGVEEAISPQLGLGEKMQKAGMIIIRSSPDDADAATDGAPKEILLPRKVDGIESAQ